MFPKTKGPNIDLSSRAVIVSTFTKKELQCLETATLVVLLEDILSASPANVWSWAPPVVAYPKAPSSSAVSVYTPEPRRDYYMVTRGSLYGP